MENLNELKNSDSKTLKTTTKMNIRKDILDVLSSSNFGLNISQIAEKLHLSRNTVKKYTRVLEEEKLILVTEIGRSKLCFAKNKKQRVAKVNMNYEFFTKFFIAFEKIGISAIPDLYSFMKTVGAELSRNIYWPTVEISDPLNSKKIKKSSIMQIANVCVQHLELLNEFNLRVQAEIVPSTKTGTASPIILRVNYDMEQFGNSEALYHLMAGFYETKLRENFGEGIHFNVLRFQKENLSCYYELKIIK